MQALIEEEIAVGNVSAPSAPKPMRREGEFDPLRPPGFTGPTYGTPGWVYVLVGLGIVTLIGVIVVVALWN